MLFFIILITNINFPLFSVCFLELLTNYILTLFISNIYF